MERILVTIKHGKATVKAIGFKGASCLAATLAVERALGQTTGDANTSEMYERPSAGAQVDVQS